MKRLDEILKRCKAATPGPYVLDYYNKNWANVWPPCGPTKTSKPVMVAKGVKRKNAVFFQRARTDLPLVTQALMKAVEALEKMPHSEYCEYWNGCKCMKSTLAEIEKMLEEGNE